MSCLWEGACLVCGREHALFVGGSMSCLWEGACPVCVVCVCLRVVSHACIVLCVCFVFTRLVYPMLPVSLDCSYLIAPSVFCNVY